MDPRLAAFATFLAVFHVSEFGLAWQRKDALSLRSLCFSWPYAAAMAAALVEFNVEGFPLARSLTIISVAGALLSAAGQALRWSAMLTAGPAFSHSILLAGSPARPGHKLVTRGPYTIARHPAYLGWAAWAVGLCGVLTTPACLALFTFLTLRFFRARIAAEEAGLRALFGEEYEAYARRTRTWLPGVP